MEKVFQSDNGLEVMYGHEKINGIASVEVTPINCQAQAYLLVDGEEVATGLWVSPNNDSKVSLGIGDKKYAGRWRGKIA